MKGKLFKRLVSGALALLMLGTALPQGSDFAGLFTGSDIVASAETQGGKCGDNATWEYDSDSKKLSIIGSGDMYDYASGKAPWYSFHEDVKSVEIAEGITSIGDRTFYYLINNEQISIPSTVTSIGEFAFYQNNKTKTIEFAQNSSLKTLKTTAFSYCAALESLELPQGVETIGFSAFDGCKALKTVVIPSTVTNIYSTAFQKCSNIEQITCLVEDPTKLTWSTQNKCFKPEKATLCYVPNGTLAAYKERFADVNVTFVGADCTVTVDKNIKNGTVTATVPKTQNIKWRCYGSLPYLDDKTEDFSDTVTASKGDTVALGIICNTDNAYAEYIAVCGDSWNETERVKGLVGHGELSYDTAITYDGKATSVYRFKFYGASLGASFCGRYTLTINWTDDATAKAGETVTLNATPDKGYVLKELTAKTSDGKEISVNKNNSFVMPDSDVTVSAEFVKQPCTVLRAAGNNRFATAAAISKLSFDKVDTVIIAYGYEYADALAGIPLAAKFNAPILLTHTKFIPNETLDEIKRLGAKKAILLGGEGVISKNSEESLKKAGLTTERIAGKTRFGTAAAIAEKVSDAPEEIFFVYGLEYADALSVNPVGAINRRR